MADLTGKTLGRYRVMERIGRGGMAEVYKGYQSSLDRYVAIKVLHPFLLEDQSARDRFQREARAVAMLRHPNIVQVYDYDSEGDVYFMVMEFIDGPNLKAILQDEAAAGRRLPLSRVAEIIAAIGGALAYAHEQGMVHRDVKPQNIMFTAKGQPLLTDFGIAKIVSGSTTNASGGLSGTPAYMSPEQGRGGPVDARTDIYSLGVVLYEMVTGRVPFDADTPFAVVIKHMNDPLPLPRSVDPQISPALERVVLKAMAKAPDERFQSAAEMVAATQQAVAEAQGQAGPALGTGFAAPPPRRLESGPPAPTYPPPAPVAPRSEPAVSAPPVIAPPVAPPAEDEDFRFSGPATPTAPVASPFAPTTPVSPPLTVRPQPPPPVAPPPTPAVSPPGPARPARRSPLPLIAAGVVVLLLLFVVGGLALSGVLASPPSPASTATAVAVASAVPSATAVSVAGADTPAPTEAAPTEAAPTEAAPTEAAPTAAPEGPTVTAAPGLVPGNQIDLAGELKDYFTAFYQARTLLPGGRFDIDTISEITAPPYRQYTVDLLVKNRAAIETGQLQRVTYSNIRVKVIDQGTDVVGTPQVTVELTRTMTEVRAGTPPARQTGTYQFRLKRLPEPVRDVLWQAYDFYNPATGQWISNGGGDQPDPSQPQP